MCQVHRSCNMFIHLALIMFSTVIRVSHGGGGVCTLRSNPGEERIVAGRQGIMYYSTTPNGTVGWREIFPHNNTWKFEVLEECHMKIAHINFVIGRNSHCDVSYTVSRGNEKHTWMVEEYCSSGTCNVNYSFHDVRDHLKRQIYGGSWVIVIVTPGSSCWIKGFLNGISVTPLFSLFLEYSDDLLHTAQPTSFTVPNQTQIAAFTPTKLLKKTTSNIVKTTFSKVPLRTSS
eukprot:scpid95739/ scgid10646/ 